MLGLESFLSSSGWLSRFKHWHGIHFRIISAESNAVTPEQTDFWATTTLPKLLADYHPNDIFNADESRLFFKLLPEKSPVLKGDSCHDGKRSKDRLTILSCANMNGTEKISLLVIGKSEKPRCFKGVNSLPTPYRANKKAWITSILFTEWMREQDREFSRQNRNVAIVIDNCPAHPRVSGLKSVT